MESNTDEAEEAADGFQTFPDQQERPSQAHQRAPSKPSCAFVAVLTALLLAYTNTSLTGMAQLQDSELWSVLRYPLCKPLQYRSEANCSDELCRLSTRVTKQEVLQSGCAGAHFVRLLSLNAIAGLCFLLAFFSWGGICITQLGTVAGRASSLALWGFVTALSAVLLVFQVLVIATRRHLHK